MCRSGDLGPCVAQGCDARIVCRDDEAYCREHAVDQWCGHFEDCSCPPPSERPADDPMKRRAYAIVETRRQRLAVEARMARDQATLASLLEREESLTFGKASSPTSERMEP